MRNLAAGERFLVADIRTAIDALSMAPHAFTWVDQAVFPKPDTLAVHRIHAVSGNPVYQPAAIVREHHRGWCGCLRGYRRAW